MERLHDILKALSLVVFIASGAFLVLLIIHIDSAVLAVARDEKSLALEARIALEAVNRPCTIPSHPCGTLATVDKTLTHISDLSIQSQKAVYDADQVAKTEMKMLPAWNASFTGTLANVDRMTATVNTSAQQLTQAALPVLTSTNQAIESTGATVRHVDALVQSPGVADSMKYITASAKSIADGTEQADAILADGRKVADRYVAPQKLVVKIADYILKGGQLVYDFIR